MAVKPYILEDPVYEYLFNQLFYHLDGHNIRVLNNQKVYLDSDKDSYMITSADDTIDFYVSGYKAFTMNGVGGAGHMITWAGLMVGTYDANSIISTSGTGSGSTTLYIGNESIDTSVSDIRAKENIKPAKIKAIKMINKLKIKEFDWKEGVASDRRAKGKGVGLIAQDIFNLIPQIVRKPKEENLDSFWAIEYSLLVPYLIKAMQEITKRHIKLLKLIKKWGLKKYEKR